MSATTGKKPAAPPLPDLRQDVVLTLPNRQEYRARVTRVSPEEIVVVLMIDAREPLGQGEVAPMAIEYPGARGLVRLEGSGTVATHDLVRFKLDGAIEVVQRRDFVRVRAVRPLWLARIGPDDAQGEWIETLTVHVSGNGLLAAGWTGDDELDVNDRVRFRMALDDPELTIEGRGRVARIGDDGQRGIAFEELDRDGRRHLVRFVFEQERIARQRTRDGEL